MNPALLQNPFHVDYQLTSENKYIGQDRSFANPSILTSNDYSTYLTRKPQLGLNNAPLNQTLSVPSNAGGLEYNPHSAIPEHSYSSSGLLLSPPSSLDGSQVSGIRSASPSFGFSGTPKLGTSNASSADHFSHPIAQYTGPVWNDATMSDLRHTRPSILHPHMSPPLTYGPPAGVTGPFFNTSHRSMDQYPTSYSFPRPSNGPDMHGLFRHTRSPTFNTLPMPATYHMHGPFSQMPAQPVGRPEGPPFDATKMVHRLVTDRHHEVSPEITASIQKGFFQVDGKWTCYRRNYFTVACAFTFKNGIPDVSVYLQRHSQLEPVSQYAISISARTASGSNQDSEVRQLVQHTPKRDKATETVPGRHPVQPAPLQSLASNCVLPAPSLYSGNQHLSSGTLGGYDYGSQSHMSAPTSYTFERIQFQKATANNGKRRAQQQYFHVVVELSVNVGRSGDDNWVIIATKQSHPMVVRGRSPGHYKDNMRRDGQTNMDPDHRSGSGGDGGPVNLPMPSYTQSSSMDWSSSHRQGHHYEGSYNRYAYELNYSQSPSTASSASRSPAESDFPISEVITSKATSPYNLDRPMLSPIAKHQKDPSMGQNVSKCGGSRDLDDVEHESGHGFYGGHSYTNDGISPRSLDFLGLSSIKSVCAS